MNPSARAMHALVRLYRHLSEGRPPRCRFHPSCSAYALEALEVHGALRGSWLTIRRLARCQPWGGFGIDPVPERH
jgi:putative membrane protein insertion efficiency factor